MSKNYKDIFDIETLLFEYASGSCNEAREILVSSYMSFCEKSCKKVYHFEHIGGMLMSNMCEPVTMKRGSLDKVLDMLEEPQAPAKPKRPAAPTPVIPDIILKKLDRKGRELRWKPVYRGIRYCGIPMDCNKETAMLIKMAPGARTPHHEHKGIEITLVLDGAFHDDRQRYTPGQIVVSDKNTHHEPIADEKDGCICLMVTEHPVHFTRGISRLLNILQRLQ